MSQNMPLSFALILEMVDCRDTFLPNQLIMYGKKQLPTMEVI